MRAGERASSLASAAEAARYLGRAADLTEEPLARAELLERAGREAGKEGAFDEAHGFLKEAIRLLDERGERAAAARVTARRAEILRLADRVGEALELVRSAYDELIGGERNADVALVAAQLARIGYFAGERELALAAVEVALEMGEELRLPEVLAEALTTKATLVFRRPHEAAALLQEAIRIARDNDLSAAGLRAQFNFSGLALEHDRLADARETLEDALAHARLRGDRTWETNLNGQLAEVLVLQGEWDRAWAIVDPLGEEMPQEFGQSLRLHPAANLLVGRGLLGEAEAVLERAAGLRRSTDMQTQAIYLVSESTMRFAQGRYAEALPLAERSFQIWRTLNQPHYEVEAYAVAIESALALDDLARAEALLRDLQAMPSIERRALIDAQEHRFRAKIAAHGGDDPHADFAAAGAIFRDLGMSYWLAVTLAEAAEAGAPDGVAEAREIFARLAARPWLERLEAVAAPM